MKFDGIHEPQKYNHGLVDDVWSTVWMYGCMEIYVYEFLYISIHTCTVTHLSRHTTHNKPKTQQHFQARVTNKQLLHIYITIVNNFKSDFVQD